MKKKRMTPEARREDILTAALSLAESSHYTNVTRGRIAAKCNVSGPAVQYHFKTMTQLRKQLMRYAVKQECLKVIVQGIMAEDTQALKAPAELRERAWADMAK